MLQFCHQLSEEMYGHLASFLSWQHLQALQLEAIYQCAFAAFSCLSGNALGIREFVFLALHQI